MKQFPSTCLTLTLAMFALVQNGVAQSPNVLDGAYVKETNLTKRVILTHLREADVMYKRRIWQEIDLRQNSTTPSTSPWIPSRTVKICLTWCGKPCWWKVPCGLQRRTAGRRRRIHVPFVA